MFDTKIKKTKTKLLIVDKYIDKSSSSLWALQQESCTRIINPFTRCRVKVRRFEKFRYSHTHTHYGTAWSIYVCELEKPVSLSFSLQQTNETRELAVVHTHIHKLVCSLSLAQAFSIVYSSIASCVPKRLDNRLIFSLALFFFLYQLSFSSRDCLIRFVYSYIFHSFSLLLVYYISSRLYIHI